VRSDDPTVQAVLATADDLAERGPGAVLLDPDRKPW